VSALDHWHPVALARELGDRPLRATLHARDLALFRTAHGVGALDDGCPHRGHPLHRGRVEGDCLVCPYHGWRWAADGTGSAPATPAAKPRAVAWEAVERMGAVWVRPAGSAAPFPVVDVSGHTEVGTLRRRVRQPLEVVLDNFTEVEHTPSVHAFLGYPADALATVTCETTVTDDAVRVYNRGPQRPLPRPLRRLFDIPDDAHFVDDWTTRFAPVHTVYDQYFHAGADGPRAGEALRIAVFFTPLGPRETDVFVFAYTSATRWERPLWAAARLPLVRATIALEVSRDCALLDAMGEVPTELRGRALGRFDKALVAARKRLESLYRGRPAGPTPPEP
jgi:phenylpropionate dioxygenase-like ring-hydroxylating dioxygenase large terminal subunit